jgi:hypothetical protein
MPLTKLYLGGNYDVIYELFLPRESLVSDIPAGDGNIEKLFLRYTVIFFRDVNSSKNISKSRVDSSTRDTCMKHTGMPTTTKTPELKETQIAEGLLATVGARGREQQRGCEH